MKILPHEIDRLRWNSIVVIESLAEGTGKELFDSKLARRCWQLNYAVAYIEAPDKDTLFAALTAIQESVLEGRMPVLHFEMHGGKDGLELVSGEVVLWGELGTFLRAINTAMNNTLLVVLAACYGVEIGTQVLPMFRAPFRGVVAPMQTVSRGTIEEGFDAFYEQLPKSFPEAVRALNDYSDDSDFRYLDPTEYFDYMWDEWKKLYDSPEKISQLVDYLFEIRAMAPGSGEAVVRQSWIDCLSGGNDIKWGVYRYFMMAESLPDEGINVFLYAQ